jgi:UDP-N-acetylglucosamine acyltransferase
VPPFTKGARYPLSYVGVNTVGLKRRGYDSTQIHEIHEIYRLLFAAGKNTTQALEAIEAEIPDSEFRREILEFVRSSPRGVMKGLSKNPRSDD